MLRGAGVDRNACLVTNVFSYKPPMNNVGHFFTKKLEYRQLKRISPYPPFGSHGFVSPEFEGEIERLREELAKADSNVILAFGATALWALTGHDKISQWRGTSMASTLLPGKKVVSTFHPAAVIREWSYRPTVMADIKKAMREAASPDIKRPAREIWIEPTYGDLLLFRRRYIEGCRLLCLDIETEPAYNLLLCCGLAPSPDVAIVLPFADRSKPDKSYWSNEESERKAYEWLKEIAEDPTIPKLFQNGSYDIQWLAKDGIYVQGAVEDTMLLHHSLEPELPKSLGYMGSLHTDDFAWKNLAKYKETVNKKDG